MKKYIFTLLSFCIVLCPLKAEAMGLFYTNATYPLAATGAEVQDLDSLKKGSASSNNFLFCVEVGDASIDKAAKKGNINKITYIDIHEKSIFIFWRKVTINVYGE